jgi:hypothetical protein
MKAKITGQENDIWHLEKFFADFEDVTTTTNQETMLVTLDPNCIEFVVYVAAKFRCSMFFIPQDE